jgi:hypothetical protein
MIWAPSVVQNGIEEWAQRMSVSFCGLRSVTRCHAARFHRDDDAQIAFIGIFGAVAFTIFLSFLINNSANLHAKMRMQQAADASALAAAQVVADGMNIISDNNVAITEYLALKSVSEGLFTLVKTRIDYHESQYEAATSFYEGVLSDCEEDGVNCNLVDPAYWEMDKWRRVVNFDMLVLQDGGYFAIKIPNLAANNILKLQKVNRDVVDQYPSKAVSEANRIARKNGADRAALLTVKLPVEEAEDKQAGWADPTIVGSRATISDSGIRGYTPVYHQYKPLQGPLRRFVEDSDLGPLKEIGDDRLLMPLSQQYLVVNIDGSNEDYRNMDMGPPIELIDFASAYEANGIVAVVYEKPREALMWAGSTARDLRPFSRRLSGFDKPQELGTTAVAQSLVYNPVSWDTFTQFWDVKLVRVKKLPDITLDVGGLIPRQIPNTSTTNRGLYH